MPEAHKIYGKFLPETIDPPERVCFIIEIPDTLQYRAALMGQLEWLADWRCWEHQNDDYTNPPERNLEAAQLFAIAVTEAEFRDCMDAAICEGMIECITGDEDVLAAFNQWLINQVNNNSSVQDALDNLASSGQAAGRSLTPGQAGANLLPAVLTDDCSRARLGAAMEFLVEYIDHLITDFFELLISLDTAAKLAAKASGLIPVIGQYTQSAAEFLIELKNKIITSYAGEQTDEVKLSIAGDFFCKAEPDCDLSIDDAIEIIVTRLGTIAPAEFGSIITLLTTGTFVGVQIVETAYLVALTAIKFGGKFGDSIGVQPLSVIIAQGAGVPNTFWNDYDCPASGSTRFDFTIDEQGWLAHAPYGTYVAATGWVGAGQPLAWLYRDWTGATKITAVRFELSGGNQLLAQVGTPEPALTSGIFNQPGSGYTDVTIDTSGIAGFDGITQIVCRPTVEGVTTWTGTLIALTLYWEGDEPTF